MKKDTHPTNHKVKATCNSCKTSFDITSTIEQFDMEVCSQCHPFYTGDQRIMDTAGRADRFRTRMAKADIIKAATPVKEVAAKVKPEVVVEPKVDAPAVEVAEVLATEEVVSEVEATTEAQEA